MWVPEVNHGVSPGWGCWLSLPRDILVSCLQKEPLVILTQLPEYLPLAGKPQFWVLQVTPGSLSLPQFPLC